MAAGDQGRLEMLEGLATGRILHYFTVFQHPYVSLSFLLQIFSGQRDSSCVC